MNSRPQFKIKAGRFSVGIRIKGTVNDVWRVITDTSLWPDWGPSIVEVKCRDRFISNGSMGSVKTILGISFAFTITSLINESEWTWSVAGITATGHRIIPIDDACCMLFFDMPVWAIPYSILCLVALNRIKMLVTLNNKKDFDLDDDTT